jgi:Glu-tRNA(Gln) amidotransferase subunit E-like FAD-binding protein|tara:strand:- start:1208 stop:1438 length:231 start_codon:yes stop_codon:yes gene_type:complete
MIEAEFMNKSKFSKIVEKQVLDKKLGYIDAVVEACKLTSIDPEDVKKFISPVIKEKIEAEAMSLNFLPRQNTLYFE